MLDAADDCSSAAHRLLGDSDGAHVRPPFRPTARAATANLCNAFCCLFGDIPMRGTIRDAKHDQSPRDALRGHRIPLRNASACHRAAFLRGVSTAAMRLSWCERGHQRLRGTVSGDGVVPRGGAPSGIPFMGASLTASWNSETPLYTSFAPSADCEPKATSTSDYILRFAFRVGKVKKAPFTAASLSRETSEDSLCTSQIRHTKYSLQTLSKTYFFSE